jgi:hypothetical protein
MSRITGNDAYGLMEAYSSVYHPRLELTEEQVWEEVEEWVNCLIDEGYDLSDYTWEEMYEAYIEEARAEGVPPYKRQPLIPLPTERPQAEQVDVYDIILSHLLDEGYANSVDAAEAIMVNMSEDWRDIIIEEILDEAEGSYGETPKAYGAALRTKMTAKRKPFLKKMLRRTNPAERNPETSPRKGMTADDRERARAGDAHGVGTRADHDYPSEGPGGVTKNPKKLRKQRAMGEHG